MSEVEAEASAGASAVERAFERLRLLGGPKRIQVIHQLSQLECGVACLAMVLAYHGRHVRLEELRTTIGVDRDGANAYAILTAARSHGLRARGLKIEVEDLIHLEPASILHWEFNHFVVFEGLDGEHVQLVDPAHGRRRVTLEQFRRAFTGVALAFDRTAAFAPRAAQETNLARRCLGVLPGGELRRVIVLSLALQLFALAAPIATGAVVDAVVPRADRHLLWVLSAGVATVVVFHFLGSFVRALLLLHLRTRVDAILSVTFLDHLVSLPFAFFQRRSSGDLLMRLNSNATIRELLTSSVLSGALDGGTAVLYLAVLFVLSPALALLALGVGLLQLVVYLVSRSRQRELMTEDLRIQAKSRAYEVEILNGVETLKAIGAEPSAVAHWANLFVDTLNAALARGRLSAVVDSALASLRLAAPIFVLMLGASRVLDGDLTLGSMLALNALAVGFLTPLSALVGTASQLQSLGTYLERLEDVLETEPEIGADPLQPVSALRGAIRVDDVTFRYGERSPNVVRDVSLEIAPGSFVAIVGRSGSGKSTLASLLFGLYIPSSGRVLYDGRDLASLDPRSVRQKLGIVVQKPYLFAASVRANVSLGDPSVPLEAIMEACKAAHIHDEIMAMPMQYETLIRDGGSLSGGQRQRLALARALVREPKIVLLDEATSSLDALTEASVQTVLERMRCTRVVIAHRLSTIMRADTIVVMHEGRIVERGTHDTLLALGGHYASLVSAQLGGAARPAPQSAPRATTRTAVAPIVHIG